MDFWARQKWQRRLHDLSWATSQRIFVCQVGSVAAAQVIALCTAPNISDYRMKPRLNLPAGSAMHIVSIGFRGLRVSTTATLRTFTFHNLRLLHLSMGLCRRQDHRAQCNLPTTTTPAFA